MTAYGNFVYGGVVLLVVFLGYDFALRELAGSQVDEEPLRSSQERMEATGENGDVLRPLRR